MRSMSNSAIPIISAPAQRSMTFDELTVSGPLTCAATQKITVSPLSGSLVEVLGTGDLHLIAPTVIFEDGFSVLGSELLGYGSMTVIPEDPCPGCP